MKTVEKLIQGLNTILRKNYPGEEGIFIFTKQVLPANNTSFKIFKQIELVLWYVKKKEQGPRRHRILTLRKVDRFEDPAVKEMLLEQVEDEFILNFMNWLSSNGLNDLIKNGAKHLSNPS